MRRFESFASWLLLAAFLSGAWYVYPTEIRTTAFTLYARVFPCSLPLTYRIGSIDSKFGISEKKLREDLSEAASLWNQEAGKDVLAYDPKNGIVVVSLAYDSRQEMTARLKVLGGQVSNDRATYDLLKSQYESTYGQFTALRAAFEQHAATFNSQKAAYEKQVAYWNGRGGAPRTEFQQLQTQKDALNAQSQSMSREQETLNATVRHVNELASTLNTLIESLKLDVGKYNETGQSHGDSFEQGVFERGVGTQTITIFEYQNNALLTRVLAHEFGHALGLDHVEDPDAIMYYLNQGDRIALTVADANALAKQCR